ncbi:MAG: UDP-3-O-acyl-N-acetylglucosamine deacetylase, partial [Bacteroidota bacterium]
MKQHTIKATVRFSGIGLHTGQQATLNIQPAPINHGIQFQRIDLANQPKVKSDVNKVSATQRCTTISTPQMSICTVEHLLSALSALHIDNALITIDADEIPILDGSAQAFVTDLAAVGLEQQEADREYFALEDPIHFQHESGAEYIALPADNLDLTTIVDFPSETIGQQVATYTRDTNYAASIAPCRTFVFLKEIKHLAEKGLVKGGDLNNAIV